MSKQFTPPCVINVPILSHETLVERVKDIANKHLWISVDMARQSFIYCRELFQKRPSELFFLPYSSGSCISLAEMGNENIFFLRNASSWSFILCFNPNVTDRPLERLKTAKLFSEDQGYPAGVGEAASFLLSYNHMSILVSEHGSITMDMDNDGKPSLKGINVFFLQATGFSRKSIFVQRKNESVSPTRPLREGIEPLQRYNKYIKVRCVCNASEFSYLTQFPVLSERELEKEIALDQVDRTNLYGDRLHLSGFPVLKYYFFKPLSEDVKHLIMFPYKMGIEVPFGCFEGGRMFFSYAETPVSGDLSGNIKITFFPSFFEINNKLKPYVGTRVKKHFKEGEQASFSVCGARKVTTFVPVGINIVPVSQSEYQLVGATVEMISTKSYGGWGVCFSRETINLSNIPIPGPSGVESRETQQEGSRSPLPGPSGVECRNATTQATATVSIPSGEQGQQTQQKGSKSPVSGGPGRSSYAYGSFFPSLPRATAFVSPEQQGKQTQKRKHSYSVSSGIGSREPTIQAAATVSVPPESENTQTQQEGRSRPFSGPFGIGREATASLSHAESTVVFPSEQQRQQTQQRSRSPLPDPSGVRHQVIRPTPFRSQPVASAFMQFEQAQQRGNRPVSAPSGASFHPYPQHGTWPFGGAPRPYFYPEIEFFVGGSYPYGYPHPAVRQGQWMPVFPSPFSAVRSPVAAFNSLRYEIPVQERGVGQSARAEVLVGAVQQIPIWRPYEEPSSAEVLPQDQVDNPDEDK